jgi:hypothetical protein
MGKTLILLTQGFPYGTTIETFLEHEIKLLSSAFDNIFIYTINCEETEQRKIPKNVFVQKIQTHYNKSYKFQILIKLFFYSEFYKEIFNIIFIYKQRITFQKLIILANNFIKG